VNTETVIHTVNPDILKRITEPEIMHWIAARLSQLMHDSGLPINTLEMQTRVMPGVGYAVGIVMHAQGVCVIDNDSTEAAAKKLIHKFGDPAKLAADKIAEAEELMRQASELKALGKAVQP
jgi:hypothetical protein